MRGFLSRMKKPNLHTCVIVREEFGNLESLVFHISVLLINFAGGDELEHVGRLSR